MRSVVRPSRALGDVLVSVMATLVVAGPALFTRNGFMLDFTNHLWLIWVQSHAISQHLLPTYFINAPAVGVFYPLYLFYGGTLYAIVGAVAALFGNDANLAYVASIGASIAAAYCGLVWVGRQLGVRSWLAHAPSIAYVASAYYVTNLYGRGAWPEFVATSMLPLVAASALYVLHAPRLRLGPCVLLVISTIVLAGSHNITLLLGSLSLIGLALALLLALGGVALPPTGRALTLIALMMAAAAVNAWFLLSDVFYASDIAISKTLYPWSLLSSFNSFSTIFDPLRHVPSISSTPTLYVQAPDYFLVWALAAGITFRASAGRRLRRAWIALIVLLALVLVALMVGPVWDSLPRVIREAQFPYRLNTYVALFVSGLVLVAVLVLQRSPPTRRRRAFELGLVGATMASVLLCLWQLWIPQTRSGTAYRDREQALVSTHVTPRTWYGVSDYADVSARVIATNRVLEIDPRSINSDVVNLHLTPLPGLAPFATNMQAGPYITTVTRGALRRGRTVTGDTVMRRTADDGLPTVIRIGLAHGALRTGRIISAVAVIGLLVALVGGCLASVWRRQAAGRPSTHGRAGGEGRPPHAEPATEIDPIRGDGG